MFLDTDRYLVLFSVWLSFLILCVYTWFVDFKSQVGRFSRHQDYKEIHFFSFVFLFLYF